MADNWWDAPIPKKTEKVEKKETGSVWRRFIDGIREGATNELGLTGVRRALSSPVGGLVRSLPTPLAVPLGVVASQIPSEASEEIDRENRATIEDVQRNRAADDEELGDVHPLSPASIGQFAVDIAGNLIGGADPTYILSLGSTAVRRIAAQAGINAVADAGNQGVQVTRGVRDEYDPYQTAVNAAAGAAFQGAGEGFRSIATGRRIRRGSAYPEFADLEKVMLGLEGGGTLDNPKVSPKGAIGPYQVMPETARAPGFGIRPWDGKSEADRARVGRQYLAAMMDKYDGDPAKVLAAYNAGPGRVDQVLKKHGYDWYKHLPEETRNYVKNGLKKLPYGERAVVDFEGGRTPYYNKRELERDQKLADGEAELNQLFPEVGLPPVRSTEIEAEAPRESEFDEVDAELIRRAEEEGDDLSGRVADIERQMEEGTPWRDISEEDKQAYIDFHRNDIKENVPHVDTEGRAQNNITPFPTRQLSEPDLRAMDDKHSASVTDLDAVRNKKAVDGVEKLEKEALAEWEDRYWKTRRILDIVKAKPDSDISGIKQALKNFLHIRKTPQWAELGDGEREIVEDLIKVMNDIVAYSGQRPLDTPPSAEGRYVGKGGKGKAANDPDFIAQDGAPGNNSVRPIDPRELAKIMGDPEAAGDKPRSISQLLRDLLDDESGSLNLGGGKGSSDGRGGENLSAEAKLIRALKKAKPIAANQRKLQHEERSRRGASLLQIQQRGEGMAGYFKQLKAAKGDLPTADYESIAKQLSKEDFDELFRKIQTSPALLPYEKLSAQSALMKLIGEDGVKVPSQSEIRLLSEIYSPAFIESLMKHRTLAEKIWHYGISALNIPRALMASADISAPFRQGIFLVGRKEFWKSLGPMFKVLFSERMSKELLSEIKSRPSYKLMRESGLSLTDPHNHVLLSKEEDFMTDLAEKIPVWGRVIKASNRAYSGFLNRLRADYFDHMLTLYEDAGVNLGNDKKRLKGLAKFINSATGRGDLGNYNSAAPALNAVLFSPRLIKARIDMLNPATYLQRDPIVRKEAWKNALSLGAIALTTMSLLNLAGMEVEADPRHPDFAKPKKGDTRYDILGGFQQYIRLASQLLTQEKITAKGKEAKLYSALSGTEGKGAYDETLADVIGRFLRSKESPIASFVHNAATGTNVIGEPFNRTKDVAGVPVPAEVLERFISMSSQDIAEAYMDGGFEKAVAATPALVGVGVQTYTPREEKEKPKKKDAKWYEDSTASDEWWTASAKEDKWWES